MSSRAFREFLEPLLADAEELGKAHKKLRTGAPGRQWGLGSVNRAAVVMCVSAWESYVEEVVKEAIETLRPVAAAAPGSWSALKASALGEIGRFNNPNVENTTRLFASCLGLANVADNWYWQKCDSNSAREHLAHAMKMRHEISHGVNPRPTIHNTYSGWLPALFRNLARCTDRAVAAHLTGPLRLAAAPW